MFYVAKSSTILVVDDEPDLLTLLSLLLRAQGFEPVTANDGYQAIEIAKSRPISLVLLDVMMPELDGFETCRRLKADPQTQAIPVVYLSAKPRLDTGELCGVVSHVTKPFEVDELLATIHKFARTT